MKYITISALLFIYLFLIQACKDNTTNTSADTTQPLTEIPGRIDNWSLGEGYKLWFLNHIDIELAESPYSTSGIDSTGAFKLSNIRDASDTRANYLPEIIRYSAISRIRTLVISDTTARFLRGFIIMTRDPQGTRRGQVEKQSFFSKAYGVFDDSAKAGSKHVMFYYFNKDVKVTGSETVVTYDQIKKRQTHERFDYDLTCTKGWNTKLITVLSHAETAGTDTTFVDRVYSISNENPSDTNFHIYITYTGP